MFVAWEHKENMIARRQFIALLNLAKDLLALTLSAMLFLKTGSTYTGSTYT